MDPLVDDLVKAAFLGRALKGLGQRAFSPPPPPDEEEQTVKAALGASSPMSSDVPGAKAPKPPAPRKPAGTGYSVVTPNAVNSYEAPRLQKAPGSVPPPPPPGPRRGGPATYITPNSGSVVRPPAAPRAPAPRPAPEPQAAAGPEGPTEYVGATVPPLSPPPPPLAQAPAPRPASPPPPPPPPPPLPVAKAPTYPPPGGNPAFEAAAPAILQQVAPGLGAAGGPLALMALMDTLGRGGGNMRTLFSGLGGQPPAAAPGGGAPRTQPPTPAAPAAAPAGGPPAAHQADGPAAPDAAGGPNALERYREWVKDTTRTGVNVPGLGTDLGNTAADMAGGVGLNVGGNMGVKALAGRAPGFLPATYALDALDMAGLNPTSDRFGKGVITGDELTMRGRALAQQNAGMRALSGFTAPLTTIATGGAAVADAGSAVNQAAGDQDWAMANEARNARPGAAPDLRLSGTGKYFNDKTMAGGAGAFLSNLHDKAWEDSSIPGLNYLGAMYEAATEGGLSLREGFERQKRWNDWARGRSAASAGSAHPLAAADRRGYDSMVAANTGADQATYENLTGGRVASPGELLSGNFRLPTDAPGTATVGSRLRGWLGW